MLTTEIKERLRTSPELVVTEMIKAFVATSPLNLMPSTREWTIFDEPLVRFVSGDDPLYTRYKDIISKSHMTPQEAVSQTGVDVPDRLSIISYILPIMEPTRLANRKETLVPARRWSHQRYYGEEFNDALRRHMVAAITEAGYLAISPILQPYYRTYSNDKVGIHSVWSERHTAFAAGHGSFGLSDGFITAKGIAHRCGSIITDLQLVPSGRTTDDHHANCVFYADGTCKACAVRCPAGAITDAGHDKRVCGNYCRAIGYVPVAVYDDETTVYGCGLCQTKVPCEYRVPLKIERMRR